MQISVRRYIAIVVIVIALGALAGLIYTSLRAPSVSDNGLTGPAFPRYTIEEDGSISKDLPVLSVSSIVRIPSRQLKLLMFGMNPIILQASDIGESAMERIVFSVDNKPSDILKEYMEYFTAIGWTYGTPEQPMSLIIRTSTVITTVDITPRSLSGRLVAISRKRLP